MLNKLTEIRAKKAAEDRGFTLIELLVVVVIIGILIAIAIPLYLNYEKGAKDKSAESDIRNAITTVNQCYSDNNNVYPSAGAQTASGADLTFTGCSITSKASSGTVLTYQLDTDKNGFQLTAKNDGGTKKYSYDSETGGSIVAS